MSLPCYPLTSSSIAPYAHEIAHDGRNTLPKHLFILNPTAGGGRKVGIAREKIEAAMEACSDPWELYETHSPRDATEKVRREASTKTPLRIYACGGDGTLNECVNGAVNMPHVALTHFPIGTGNDFIKTFGPNRLDFFSLNKLLNGNIVPLDVIDLGGHFGINICSVGLDARIGADVHQYSKLPLIGGKTAYLVSLLANTIRKIGTSFTVEIGGKTIVQKFTLICACNGQSYGGTFTPVPTASPTDGLLDILLVKKVSRAKVLHVVKTYARGQQEKLPDIITHKQDTSITISAPKPFAINVDGEILERDSVTFTLLPKAINFIVPNPSA